ncbi:translation initiation factor IF-2-like [Peromyscus californicus insignis]|uniref:translation initiation factor IF-2-like n=1 Tax=Peromyscus californicus insignis TaxID=564181 RepID=UPI0022A70B51|nr:translation initiation factor IF-2-like [Peromyscus californicus insignis]
MAKRERPPRCEPSPGLRQYANEPQDAVDMLMNQSQDSAPAARSARGRPCEPGVIANAEAPGGGGTEGTERTYLRAGSSPRPWRPLGSQPRGPSAPGPAARQARGGPGRDDTRDRRGDTDTSPARLPGGIRSLHTDRQQQRWNSNPKSPPSGARDWHARKWRHPASSGDSRKQTAAPLAPPGRGWSEPTAWEPGRERHGGTWALWLSTGRAFPPPVMLCVGKADYGWHPSPRSSLSAAGVD